MITKILFLLQEYLYLLGTSFILILVGFGVGLLCKKWTYKILIEIELNNKLASIGIPYNAQDALSSILSYVVYVFTIVYVLRAWEITSLVFYIILSALLVLIALTILVGIKSIIPDLFARFLIRKKEHIKVGKNINRVEIHGKIIRIGLVETQIKTKSGDVLFVPNSFFFKKTIH